MHRCAAVWMTIRLGLASEREECATAVASEAFRQDARNADWGSLSLPTVIEAALSTLSLRRYHRVLCQLLGWHFDSEQLVWTVVAAVDDVGVGVGGWSEVQLNLRDLGRRELYQSKLAVAPSNNRVRHFTAIKIVIQTKTES